MANRPTKAEMQELRDALGRANAQLAIQRADIAELQETEQQLCRELTEAKDKLMEGWDDVNERAKTLQKRCEVYETQNDELTRERDKARYELDQSVKRYVEVCKSHQTERQDWHHEREILRGIIQMLAGRTK